MDEIRINQLAFGLGILYTIWLTYKIIKRSSRNGTKTGCLGIGYIYLIVASISSLAIGGTVALTMMIITKTQTVYKGDKYEARVVSYTSYESRNSDDNGYTTMYTPTVHFTTRGGEVVEYELDYSSSGMPTVGDQHTVYYDETNEHVTTFGLGTVALILAFGVMIVILVYLFVGMVIYAMNWSMDRYKEIGAFLGLAIVLPLIMILFDGAMIWALFDGKDKPLWVNIILVFFSLVLTLAIWGYLKNIYGDGLKNMGMNRKGIRRVDNTRFGNTTRRG
ncbi:DUF3592 domain-containing protein [Myroides odoratimimus]|uniref:DUF3592 domain-containing protein n=1 Tax=Myroides odoratimimus CIP 101113 TaxID=883154 RepID=A0AAV3F844_9FLAO|nr:DUF3592 domain-containing protein [Myroides odoratimimus]EHO15117.1 hypothetical protein HMPREF9715_00305 [Myroides odoratimimus CIP 101113]